MHYTMKKPVEVKEPIRLELSEITNVVLKILCFFVCYSQNELDSFGSDYWRKYLLAKQIYWGRPPGGPHFML